MRFLRMFANSLLAGALGAAYSRSSSFSSTRKCQSHPRRSCGGTRRSARSTALQLAVLFYVTMVVREFVSLDVFSPGWVSVRLLAWLSAVAAAVAALLMWLNLRGLPAVFDEAASRRFAIGAAGHRRLGGGAAGHRGRALLVRSTRQPGRGDAARDCDDGLARVAVGGSRARRRAEAPAHRVTARPTVRPTRRCRTSCCCCSTARRSSSSGPAPRKGGCRISAGCSTAGRRSISRRSGPRSPIRSGPPSPPACIRPRTACASAISYFAGADNRRDRSAPGSLFLAGAGPARDGPRRAQVVRGMAGAADLVGAGRLRHQRGVVRWPLTYPAEPVRGFLVTDRFHSAASARCSRSTAAPTYSAGQHSRSCTTRSPRKRRSTTRRRPRLADHGSCPDVALGRWDQFYSRATHDLLADQPVTFTADPLSGRRRDRSRLPALCAATSVR